MAGTPEPVRKLRPRIDAAATSPARAGGSRRIVPHTAPNFLPMQATGSPDVATGATPAYPHQLDGSSGAKNAAGLSTGGAF